MRPVRLILAAAFLAGTLAAQTPARRGSTPAPVVQSLTVDLAAVVDDRYRIAMEPLTFGRISIGLVGAFTRTPTRESFYPYPYPVAYAPLTRDAVTGTSLEPMPCYDQFSCGQLPGAKYRAWNFDVSVRWYPAFLSYAATRQRVMAYVGEFVGWHQRRIEVEPFYYYGCPYCEGPVVLPATRDSAIVPPYPPVVPVPSYGPAEVYRLDGWEPGVEIGARIVPVPHVFVDVGGWFKLVRLADPMQIKQPGDIESKLVVAIGIGW